MKKSRIESAVAAVRARVARNGFAVLNSKGISAKADHKLFILISILMRYNGYSFRFLTDEGKIIISNL